MDDFKWGVIGTIDKVKAFAADLPNASGQHSLYAFMPSMEGSAVDTIPIPHLYNDIQQLLHSEVDAVYIASPYHQHYAQVKQCLLNGKPVLCERPIASNADELRHLMQLSEHNNVFMMEAMWIRFLPSIKKTLSIISTGAIGEIVSVKASINYKSDSEVQTLPNSGTGALFELGIYPVFLSTLLLGKPEYVQAKGKLKGDSESDFFSAFLSYEGGQYAFIETTRLPRNMSSATITGDKGLIQIKNPWSEKPEGIEVDFFDGTKVLHKSEWEGHGLQFELSEVYECVENNEIESQLYCHHFSLDVMETMDEIRKQLS
jgi:predicted dehydrogenase